MNWFDISASGSCPWFSILERFRGMVNIVDIRSVRIEELERDCLEIGTMHLAQYRVFYLVESSSFKPTLLRTA